MIKNKFYYTTINYQLSLFDNDSSAPVAIVVASFAEEKVIIVGKSIDNKNEEYVIIRRYLKAIPNLLLEKLKIAIKEIEQGKKSRDLFFDCLSSQLNYNFYLSPIKTYKGNQPIQKFASDLFIRYILRQKKG